MADGMLRPSVCIEELDRGVDMVLLEIRSGTGLRRPRAEPEKSGLSGLS